MDNTDNIDFFVVGLSKMEGLTFNDGIEELKTKFWPTYKVR